MSLEDKLHVRLRRVQPPDDFAAKVLAQLDTAAPRSAPRITRWAMAASLLLIVGTGLMVQQQREQARREAAGRQLAHALDITSRQLENARRHLENRTVETGS
jgi:hypothetical protein